MFFDFKKNKEAAENIASQLTDEAKPVFMKNFYNATRDYKKNYYLVELVVDNNFSPDFSAS